MLIIGVLRCENENCLPPFSNNINLYWERKRETGDSVCLHLFWQDSKDATTGCMTFEGTSDSLLNSLKCVELFCTLNSNDFRALVTWKTYSISPGFKVSINYSLDTPARLYSGNLNRFTKKASLYFQLFLLFLFSQFKFSLLTLTFHFRSICSMKREFSVFSPPSTFSLLQKLTPSFLFVVCECASVCVCVFFLNENLLNKK